MGVGNGRSVGISRIEGCEPVMCCESLLRMLERKVGFTRKLINGRLARQRRIECQLGPRQTAAPLVDVDRDPDRFCLVARRAVDRLTNPPPGVGTELCSSSPI